MFIKKLRKKGTFHLSARRFYLGQVHWRKLTRFNVYYRICNKNNTEGIIVSFDFEKAFDRVEWNVLNATLEMFSFGPVFHDLINIFQTDMESAVLNNGFTTNWFKIDRSLKQGCPLSAHLFILVIEVLGIKLRKNNNIKSIGPAGADPGFDQGGGAQIVTGLKLPFWGLSFVEFWCWGLIFGGQGGGPGPRGPPWIRPWSRTQPKITCTTCRRYVGCPEVLSRVF